MALTNPKVEVLPRGAVAVRFAEVLVGQVSYAVEHRSKASIAFSRPTPEDVFAEVGRRARVPRGRVEIFQVDERHVTENNDDRNHRLLAKHLPALIDDSAYLPMRKTDSLSRNAKAYAEELEKRCGRPPVLDFVHLGLGPDGHTASLKPGDPVLDVRDRWLATTKKHDKYRRLTLTYPVLDAARLVVFVVAGSEKADVVQKVLRGDQTMPAARVSNGNVLFLLDPDAARRI